MVRQLLSKLAVTMAFGSGAIVTALVLDISSVQAYLGMAAIPVENLVPTGLAFVATAAGTGLVVDGLRLVAATCWRKQALVEHDLKDFFQAHLA
jgi:hypothetical protein